jgi:large subunit ribosomal protein L2
MPGKITSIEYDPNRTAFISLVVYPNGAKRYILCPKDITVGSTIIKSEKTDIKPGNSLKVVNIPESTFIHNIELFPHKGAQIVRSAGAAAQVLGKDETGKYMIVKLASGEYRKIPNDCYATIGIVGNEE